MNNCGPASIAEVLSFWGINRTQGQVQDFTRADGNYGGMSPFGVPLYAQSLGMQSLLGVGATQGLVKALVSNGFPVIVSQWVSLDDHYGHYRPIEAYDDQRGIFISSDPYLGANHQISYDEFGKIWGNQHERFMVIYPPDHQALLNAVVASAGWDAKRAYQDDLVLQQYRLATGQDGPSGWGFRQGYNMTSLAWAQVQLGQYDAARDTLQQAAAQRTSPVLIDWIRAAIPAGAA